ncbi:MAG TPA: aminoglycoside phosphotransferase family protein [Lachnospiraceae bacterium]|nr:aminoglycoside phosphotransferase family protein [Lachnospiraceae bacterium]HEX3076525.1 aminoglycoside phosphotransferase family protein [Lachnospiraceae bacterium]
MAVQEKVQWAKKKWYLRNLIVIYERDSKAVYSSESDLWGNVILKVNRDTEELASEYSMLIEMAGKCSCRVFAYDAEQGVLIEERITPGLVLRKEEDVEVRVKHFLNVFRNIHKRIDNVQSSTSYLDWLRKADDFCMDHNVDILITNNMHKARCIGEELFCKYADRVLLHGDLHHDNMIRNDKGIYYMIDPKGVIGPEIFDLPRYILNEMDYVSESEYKNHVFQIAEMISSKSEYPLNDIIKLFFMEVMLANVWCIEDNEEPSLNQIQIAEELMNDIY